MSTTNLDLAISALVSGYTGLRAELVALITDCDVARIPTLSFGAHSKACVGVILPTGTQRQGPFEDYQAQETPRQNIVVGQLLHWCAISGA